MIQDSIQSKQIRDNHSQAVLSTDAAALNKYKAERALYRKVSSLSKELEEVKMCLVRLSERLDQIENN